MRIILHKEVEKLGGMSPGTLGALHPGQHTGQLLQSPSSGNLLDTDRVSSHREASLGDRRGSPVTALQAASSDNSLADRTRLSLAVVGCPDDRELFGNRLEAVLGLVDDRARPGDHRRDLR
jgi:hypothetical protein